MSRAFRWGTLKRKTIMRTLLLICFVAISTSATQNLRTATVAAVSTQSPHAPILIRGNADFTSSNGVTGGSGTLSDPYVISGWNISTGLPCSGGSCTLQVINTTAPFIVSNVALRGASNNITVQFNSANNFRIESSTLPPVLVESSTNVTLIGNTISSIVQIEIQPFAVVELKTVTNFAVVNNYVKVPASGGFHVNGLYLYGTHQGTVSGNSISANTAFSINYSSEILISNNDIAAYPDIKGWSDGLGAGFSTNIQVIGNRVSGGSEGIGFDRSPNATIIGNTVNFLVSPYDTGDGIYIGSTQNVRVSRNAIQTSYCLTGAGIGVGFTFGSNPSNIQIFENNVTTFSTCPLAGVSLQSASSVSVYHNNFVGSAIQGHDDKPGANSWDNGYPSGGNYWSDYKGIDNCSGPQQNICPKPDGIGDTAYSFNTGKDNYPLMKPRTAILATVMRGTDNGLYWNKLSSGTWTGWGSLSGATPSAPTVCSSGSNMILVVRGLDNGIYLKTFTNDMWSSSWNSPGGSTNDQPACAILDSTLYLVVRGLDNVTYANSMSLATSTWSGWANLGGQTPSPPVLVGTSSADRLDLVVRGLANGIYHKAFANGAWTPTWDTPGGATPDIPSAVTDGRAIDIVVRGMDNGLWYNSYNFTSGSWSNWFSIGGATVTAPSLAIDSSGSLHLLVTGLANGIWHISRTAAGVWSPKWDSPGGSTPDRPALVRFGAEIVVLVRGTNNSVFSDILGESAWYGWTDLGETTNSPPAISSL